MKTNRALGIGLTFFATIGCNNGPTTAFERLQLARQLAAEALVQFTKAADASNRAVMADNDTAAVASVREVEQARSQLQASIDTLKPILSELNYANESKLLDEFTRRLAEYRESDQQILQMVDESGNLKAQRLSFGAARKAADGTGDALRAMTQTGSEQARLDALVATLMLSVRDIQALQAPHIAEPADEAMTVIERRMAADESTARSSLAALTKMAAATEQPHLAAASASLDEFLRLNTEILALSRRNSNVHALALSLGQKRNLVAACDESLRALQDALGKRGFTGTR